ncbi:LOW QUALITY PROTEIN: putative RNA polymerase II subunit B1 CTD phosphatase Rpap2 [Ptychodera flava]|uniref:LOW QUALITY PROTEIN: putative RNA polymerase II subunit B1 CTD phosphatase Rpap2 n=1 Tax=Ptychodera flava TaxID=63121 RepID=UPI00396A7AAD
MSTKNQTTGGKESERRAELRAKIVKQVESEKRAHQLVEKLLENPISSEYLIDCAVFITPQHYLDVVEERAISSLCGYPVCEQKLQNVPKQKYHISTKANNVYDITERKNFCSNHCFKASKYFEKQLSSSPVWLREEERPERVNLLSKEASKSNVGSDNIHGGCGEEVLHVVRVKKEDVERPNEDDLTVETVAEHFSELMRSKPLSPAGDDSLDKIACSGSKAGSANGEDFANTSEPRVPNNNTLEFNNAGTGNNEESIKPVTTNSGSIDGQNELPEKSVTSTCTDQGQSKPGSSKEKKAKKRLGKKAQNRITAIDIVSDTLFDWRTVESVALVFGRSAASKYEIKKSSAKPENQSLCQAEEAEQCSTKNAVDFQQPTTQENNDILPAATTQTSELTDTALSFPGTLATGKTILSEPQTPVESAKPTGPLPDWKTIKTEQDVYEFKVMEFFAPGTLRKQQQTQKTESLKEVQEKDSRPLVLPPVDSKSQKEIRRKIVLDKLRQVNSAVLGPLGLTQREVSENLNALLKTFDLKSTNIILRPPEWLLMGIVLLYLLSNSHSHFKEALSKSSSVEHLSLLMKQVGATVKNVQKVVEKFKD